MNHPGTLGRGAVAAAAATLLLAGPAAAHPFFPGGEAPADSLTTVTLDLAHGCGEEDGGSPTVQVALLLPDEVTHVDPPDADGWVVEVEQADDGRDDVVTWTADGGAEPAPTFDLDLVVDGDPGDEVWFQVFQDCEEGSVRWIGTPDEPADDPGVRLTLTEPDPDNPPPSPAPTPAPSPEPSPEPTTEEAAPVSPGPTPDVVGEPEPAGDEGDGFPWLLALVLLLVVAGVGTALAVRSRGRGTSVGMLTLLFLVLMAAPAAADPAGPTHYRSTITAVEADGDPPATLEVLGGDAFLVLRVEPGVQAEVPGYEGEPYIRFLADGTVEVNERSPARWLNDARYGEGDPDVEVPQGADPDAPPDWRRAAEGGVYAWHDHRIHWMSPSLPGHVDPAAGGAQPVQDWEIPFTVDGQDVVVRGELVWVPGPPTAVPYALVGGLAAVGIAAALSRPRLVPWLVAGGAVLTGAAAAAGNLGLPPGSDGDVALLILPPLSLALAALGLRLARREDRARGPLIGAAGGVPLLVWGVLKAGALTRPIVPPPIPTGLMRLLVALALAVGIAALVAAARTALDALALEEDDLDEEPASQQP